MAEVEGWKQQRKMEEREREASMSSNWSPRAELSQEIGSGGSFGVSPEAKKKRPNEAMEGIVFSPFLSKHNDGRKIITISFTSSSSDDGGSEVKRRLGLTSAHF